MADDVVVVPPPPVVVETGATEAAEEAQESADAAAGAVEDLAEEVEEEHEWLEEEIQSLTNSQGQLLETQRAVLTSQSKMTEVLEALTSIVSTIAEHQKKEKSLPAESSNSTQPPESQAVEPEAAETPTNEGDAGDPENTSRPNVEVVQVATEQAPPMSAQPAKRYRLI